jgi:hypothetical protein
MESRPWNAARQWNPTQLPDVSEFPEFVRLFSMVTDPCPSLMTASGVQAGRFRA